MCGIAGVYRAVGEPPDESLLRSMTERLHHRGPDGAGYLIWDQVGLGHRRLAIIDTRDIANQPLINESGTVALIFNGEIYNFRELRERLEAKGHRFATRTDGEAILHAWEEYGSACVDHLRGMFAFAVLDRKQRRLLLARDRMGKKPLYYSARSGVFAFASEIKALRELPEVDLEIDPAAVVEFMTYGYTAGERTIFKGIRRLAPAHRLCIDLGAPTIPEPRPESYWRMDVSPDETRTEEDWLEELDATLAEAVSLRLVSDVPLGAFLSGGVDSSLVVAYMAALSEEPVSTFTMGFDEASYDETELARAVADHLGTRHRTEKVTADVVRELPALVEAFDEPFGDASALPTLLLSRLTRREVTVALSGDGGDELFAGYDSYRVAPRLERLARWATPLGRGLADAGAHLVPHGSQLRRALESLALSPGAQFEYLRGWRKERLSLLQPELRQAIEEARPSVPPNHGMSLREADLKRWLPDDILVKVDRTSMQHSLEVRCPLLDQRVVELAARMPERMLTSPDGGKRPLRTLARRRLPGQLLDRPKQGFSVPLGVWFQRDLPPRMEEILSDVNSPVWGFLSRERTSERARRHGTWGADSGALLWRVVFLHAWFAQAF